MRLACEASPSPPGAAPPGIAPPAPSLSSSSGASAPAPTRSLAARPPRAFVIHEQAQTIKPWEVAFAKQLYARIPTPRAAKRFTNVYCLLNASVRRADRADFEGIAEVPPARRA